MKYAIEIIEEWLLYITVHFHGEQPNGQRHIQNNLNELLQLFLPSHLYHLTFMYRYEPPYGYLFHAFNHRQIYFIDGQYFQSTWSNAEQRGTIIFS